MVVHKLQKSCITGIFGQSEGEHNIKCNELYKYNVRVGKSDKVSKFSDDCYSTVLVYSMQLNGLFLALLTGLYVIALKKNTSFHFLQRQL